MILTVILISVVISFIYWYFVASYNHWRNRNIPGPKPKLFHGNFPSLVKKNRNVVEDFMDIYETYHNREPIIGIYVLRHPELMVLDPELVKDILVKYQRKFGENFFSYTIDKNDKLFGPNLFFLHQNEWKSKRQELSSGFAVNKIKAQFDNIHQIAQDFCKYIKTQSKSQNSSTFEVKSISIRYTAEIASSVVFGVQGNSFTEDDPAILSVSSNLIPFSVAEQILNYFKRIYLLPFLARFTKTRISIKSVEAFYEKLTIDVLRQRQNDGTVRNDYVDHMLQLMKKKGLNEVDMTGDFINLFLDTFETTSIFMSNVLFEIARHPEVQNRIREEISALEDKKLDFESVESLEYLENVIFESLRLHPVLTNLVKVCTEPHSYTTSDGKTITIQKGDVINIPIYCIHRDPNVYPDPETFNPDRFTSEGATVKKLRQACSLLPFGEGPRQCLGMRYSLAEVKIMLIELLRQFELNLTEKSRNCIELFPDSLLYLSMPMPEYIEFKPLQ